jgi:hypothetical protein
MVLPDEGFDSFSEWILALKVSSVERLSLEQTEHDLNLIQPTGRSRREMQADSPLELGY